MIGENPLTAANLDVVGVFACSPVRSSSDDLAFPAALRQSAEPHTDDFEPEDVFAGDGATHEAKRGIL